MTCRLQLSAMAATRWLPAGGGSDGGAEVLDDVGDDALWPPFCEQPSPSQVGSRLLCVSLTEHSGRCRHASAAANFSRHALLPLAAPLTLPRPLTPPPSKQMPKYHKLLHGLDQQV